MIHYLKEQSKQTGEEYYIYDSTMQFNGYHGEICDDSYNRKQDTEFPTIVGTFWGVSERLLISLNRENLLFVISM